MIPELVGSEESAIELSLQHLDLRVGQRAALYHETAAPGVIIAQSPPPGEALLYGKSVSILVSLGPRPKAYVMPNRIGSNIQRTEREFKEMGFSVVVDRQEVSAPEDWDRIVDQDPPSGAKLVQGSEVVFTVGVRQVAPEQAHRLNIPVPDSATGKFVTVAIYDASGGRTGDPQTFKVPVSGASDEIALSIPFKGKVIIEVYDGAVEGGALLYRKTFEARPETSREETQE
jgi:beta-lactam-binding protein with PASTA domain